MLALLVLIIRPRALINLCVVAFLTRLRLPSVLVNVYFENMFGLGIGSGGHELASLVWTEKSLFAFCSSFGI